MSIKVAQNDITWKMKEFYTVTIFPENVGNLGKIIVATGSEKMPKVQ